MTLGRAAALVALGIAAACARIGAPEGGPADKAPPVLLGTVPESTVVAPAFKGDAEFRFNEIVSEGTAPNFGLGTGDLEKLVILSPSPNVPSVSWKRSRIAVHPKEGWQKNRVYRIELLPGIGDLRNNRAKGGRVITFTTGAPAPTRTLVGRVVDWGTQRGMALGLVEAMLLPDSLRYRTLADSTGRFQFGPLPAGDYVVAGVSDQNRNNKFDPRENFDTVRVLAGRDTVGELWTFKHDSAGPRMQTLAKGDSLSITVSFNQQLDPYQRVPADSVRVRLLPDSSDLGVDAVLPRTVYDSIYQQKPAVKDTVPVDTAKVRKAREDSIARADSVARADSIAKAIAARRNRNQPPPRVEEGPLKTKPPLFDNLVIRVKTPLKAGAKYVVDVRGIRSVSGVPGKMVLGFQIPEEKPPPADSAKLKAKADSTGRPRDSLPAKPDSVRARDSLPARRDTLRTRDSLTVKRDTARTRSDANRRPR